MFKYGLYLLDQNQSIFRDSIVPVEGFLVPPGTKVIGVWAELNYNNSTLTEVLPYSHQDFKEDEADMLLKRIVKRFKERLAFIEEIGGKNGANNTKQHKTIPQQQSQLQHP